MQRFVKVDGKVRTDSTYPAGLMDVIDIDTTDEHFRLLYDSKGRFVTHRISKASPACLCLPAQVLCSFVPWHLIRSAPARLPCQCGCSRLTCLELCCRTRPTTSCAR